MHCTFCTFTLSLCVEMIMDNMIIKEYVIFILFIQSLVHIWRYLASTSVCSSRLGGSRWWRAAAAPPPRGGRAACSAPRGPRNLRPPHPRPPPPPPRPAARGTPTPPSAQTWPNPNIVIFIILNKYFCERKYFVKFRIFFRQFRYFYLLLEYRLNVRPNTSGPL